MTIFCTGCGRDVDARLTNGSEVYPHRLDLAKLPFWICDRCKNFVGTHYKTDNHTRPLGVISTPELRRIRVKIHDQLDSLWRDGLISRTKAYTYISDHTGKPFHTAELRSVDEGLEVLRIVGELRKGVKL